MTDRIDSLDERLKVGMGVETCWFKYHDDSKSQMIFLYVPLALILVLNISSYSFTAFKIKKIQNETAMIREPNSKRHSMEKEKNR